MTITFVTNLVHHHQLPVADELYQRLGDNFHYITCEEMPDWLVKGGYDPTLSRPYILHAFDGKHLQKEVKSLIDTSDVVIIGSAPLKWADNRKRMNKITFHYNERWIKDPISIIKNPISLFLRWRHHFPYRNKNAYLLCASAFAARDANLLGCYKKKAFKWGYITKVEEFDANKLPQVDSSDVIRLMWCSRFLEWKHPELPVILANRLKKNGYKFLIDMFGSGEKLEEIKELAKKLQVLDVVRFQGNRPNDQIIAEMRNHTIFLFTSDRGEGWGAVANESMSNGCVLVGSDEIGAVPYLLEDGVNGCVFKSKSIESLEEKVKTLLDNPDLIMRMRSEALRTMRTIWSPAQAADNLINLINHISNGHLNEYSLEEGPCSWA